VLLLLFYVAPSFSRYGLLAEAVGNELLLILAPTLLFAHTAGWKWRETFSLRPAPGPAVLAAALLGVGLAPWAGLAQEWLNRGWPPDPTSYKQQMDAFTSLLRSHAALKAILIGALAGTCEEILFRGPIQISMLRRIPPWAAIGFTAILFSAIHLDVHGFPLRTFLGALLGYLAWRSASIYTAMIAHGLYDTAALALGAWQLQHPNSTTLDIVTLAIGAALILAGLPLWRRSLRSAEPDPG
jgi:membrane protease YdiL (CAAX protease family)